MSPKCCSCLSGQSRGKAIRDVLDPTPNHHYNIMRTTRIIVESGMVKESISGERRVTLVGARNENPEISVY